jgi:TetR/AcrR family transcriptional regulator, transcriptional repressor for nem operon
MNRRDAHAQIIEADEMALHVPAWSQGVAPLANTFHDDDYIRLEVRQLEDWLDSLIEGLKRN